MRNLVFEPKGEGDRRLLYDVQTYGWHIIHVGMTEGDEAKGPEWSYSIGLFHTFGHPELIIVGLPWSTAQAILNDLASRVRAGQRFETGMRDPDVLENHDVRFLAMAVDQYRAHLGYAIGFYHSLAFPVLQVVWPDRAGRFPGEPGCVLNDSTQPVLGPIEEA